MDEPLNEQRLTQSTLKCLFKTVLAMAYERGGFSIHMLREGSLWDGVECHPPHLKTRERRLKSLDPLSHTMYEAPARYIARIFLCIPSRKSFMA